jgi:hypothetical protein
MALAIMVRSTASLLFLIFAVPIDAGACSCARSSKTTVELASLRFEQYDIVGVYEVAETVRREMIFSDGKKNGRWVVLKAVHSFKGAATELVTPAVPRFVRSSCDVELEQGDLLLVYALMSEPVSTSACSPSGRLRNRLEELGAHFRSEQPLER